MPHEEIMQKIGEIFREVFDDDSLVITEQTSAKDIEDWDSLTHVELVRAVEKAFGIRFTSAEILTWKNVGEMVESVARHKA